MEFRVLGPLEVHDGGGSLPLGSGRRLRSLLALFLSRPNQILSTDLLIESLWSEEPPPSAATALRVHLTRLRTRLEPNRPRGAPSGRLVTEPSGYRLAVERDELDASRFEQLVALARRESPVLAAAAYAEADSLWRGAAFADYADLEPVRAEAVRLEELRVNALEESFEIRLALGEHAAIVGSIQTAVDENPLRERLAAQLMLALYRSGRQAEALRAYSDLRARLGEGLGIEPDVALSRLETAIIRHESDLDLPFVESASRDALGGFGGAGARPATTTLLVTGATDAVEVEAFHGRRIDRGAPAAVFAFGSADDALRCAAHVLGANRRATIGMSVGVEPTRRGGRYFAARCRSRRAARSRGGGFAARRRRRRGDGRTPGRDPVRRSRTRDDGGWDDGHGGLGKAPDARRAGCARAAAGPVGGRR